MKNELINNGIYKDFLKVKKDFYLTGIDGDNKENYLRLFTREQIDNCFSIYNAMKQRKTRNLDRIIQMKFAIDNIKGFQDCVLVFLTFTFRDEALASTKPKTRRRYVQTFLYENTITYFANIDFGEENGREHYHALVMIKGKINPQLWKYGSLNIIKIKNSKKDIKRIKNYILKFNNHSYKESTCLERIIYPKKNIINSIIEVIYPQEYHQYKLIFLSE